MKKFIGIFIASIIVISCASTPNSDLQTESQTTTDNTDLSNLSEIEIEECTDACDVLTLTSEDLEQDSTEPEIKTQKYTLRQPTGKAVRLTESWGYVMRGREEEFDRNAPITDVCYFNADINCYGELMDVPPRSKIKNRPGQKVHLVIACDSRAAVHQALNPSFETRKQILKDIVRAAAPYDGVQLDLEYIPLRDRKHFITFIGDLRYMLKGKMLSVCVPARFRLLKEDMYPYKEIALYCDRVFVMAYDEHWSTSRPGAIANIDWCKKVAQYAVKEIPAKKLIMGIPFYGRTWADKTTASAWYFSGINRIMTENDVAEIIYENDIPTAHFTETVDITAYFNDAYSLVELSRLYESMGIYKLGYWRLGQEDPEFWNWIEIRN